MTIRDNIGSLIQLLKEETSVYSKIIEVLKEEKKALINLDTESINITANKKEMLSLKIKSLEEARDLILEKISQDFNILKTKLTISEISSNIEEPFSSEITSLKNNLLSLINEIQILNSQNRFFLQNSINIINDSMEFLRRSLGKKENNIYKKPKIRKANLSYSQDINIISQQI